MTLSAEVSRLPLPSETGAKVPVFDGSGVPPLEMVASRFLVTVPQLSGSSSSARTGELMGFLRTWQGAARHVVASLYDPNEAVSDADVRSGFSAYQSALEGSADAILSSLGGGWVMTAYRWSTGSLQQAIDLGRSSVRAALLYAFTAASAGVEWHADSAARALALQSGEYTPTEDWRDFVVRAGTFQAIVALAKTGVLDSLAAPTAGLGAYRPQRRALGNPIIGAGILIVTVALIAAAVAAVFIVPALWETSARNTTLRKFATLACNQDPSKCGELVASLSKDLASPPEPTLMASVKTYALYAVAGLVGIIALPYVLDAVLPRRRS